MSPRALTIIPVIGFVLIELILRRGRTARSWAAGESDRGTTAAILGAYALTALALSVTLPGPVWPVWLQWLALGLACVGVIVRVWAFRALGQFYTRTLVTTEEQTVVQTGPYRWVRHPGYLGSLMIWVGVAVASGQVIPSLLVLGLMAAAYAYRIAVEEHMLVASFGPAYTGYQARSWRLLPFIY
ncbi:MAG: isoprenylcysteine carboxylmethyltransferase family protein [Anaerolineae bacterium]